MGDAENKLITSEGLIEAQGPIRLGHGGDIIFSDVPGPRRHPFDTTPPRPLGASDAGTIFEG